MGVFRTNNMGNLRRGAEAGAFDAIAHIGDHSCKRVHSTRLGARPLTWAATPPDNLGQDDDRRGDGYMNAYQPILSQLPWLAIVGNHEYYDGGHFMRFLEQMGGVAMGRPAAVAGAPTEPHRTTASSSLGLMLSAGGAMGGGSHGTTPSNTSRFYSVDVGRKSSKCRTAASALDPRPEHDALTLTSDTLLARSDSLPPRRTRPEHLLGAALGAGLSRGAAALARARSVGGEPQPPGCAVDRRDGPHSAREFDRRAPKPAVVSRTAAR